MLVSGLQIVIYTAKFNLDGNLIAFGSNDKNFQWNVHGDCRNFMVLRGYKNVTLDLHWTIDGSQMVSANLDKGLRAWISRLEIKL